MKHQSAYKEDKAAQLTEWSSRIRVLEKRIEKADIGIKLRRAEEMHELRAKRRLASEKMKELDKATGEAWGHVSRTADKIWADLKTGVDAAHSAFK